MEHKLIRGGEQYLPFARSAIAKLKGLGQPYANQCFKIGTADIEVRIIPGQEFIRIEDNPGVYMETGQLEFTWPGDENPTRLDPAKWHFLDIPTTDDYLGSIKVGRDNLGEQSNKPALTEGMDSKAIGYPKKTPQGGATPEAIAAIEARNTELKEAYGDSTIGKKVVASSFPASLFSGKLRSFVQAQYGARERIDGVGFYVVTDGLSKFLRYRDKAGSSLQFGLWSHATPGIYVAPDDGSYWLINITNPKTTEYVVAAYQIKLSKAVTYLREKFRKPETPQEEKEKIEAYMLSDAEIRIATPIDDGISPLTNAEIYPKEIGRFQSTRGSTLAYGWKFNKEGSEATVIVHETLGSIETNDLRFRSSTIRLEIFSSVNEDTKARTFTVAPSTTVNGEWFDGWGYFNIFVPTNESFGTLEHVSFYKYILDETDSTDFAATPVYGYYDEADIWQDVTIGKSTSSDFTPIVKSSGMTFFGDGLGVNSYETAYHISNVPCSFSHVTPDKILKMPLVVAGKVYDGAFTRGNWRKFAKTIGEPPGESGNAVSFISSYAIGVTGGVPPAPPGKPYRWTYGATYYGEYSYIPVRTDLWAYYGAELYQWTLVIPPADCSAVIVATRELIQADGATTHNYTEGNQLRGFKGTVPAETSYGVYHPPVPYDFIVYAPANTIGEWYGLALDHTVWTDGAPDASLEIKSFAYNVSLYGQECTPSGSYTTLFEVDRTYPYYNGVMYFYTSAGKRYVMSEGLKSPASVNYLNRFVGWA